jgi:hypothetical protein
MVGAAQAADSAAVGPQVSAAQLIAMHGNAAEPVLRIAYDTVTDAEAGRLIVDIAPDFVSVKKTSGKEAGTLLYDFRLKRAISLDEAHHTFSNDSIYMMVDFRYIESFNRKMLRGVLGRLGVSKQLPQAQNPYWDQQSLSFLAPNDDKPIVESKPTPRGGMEYLVDGSVAASFEPSAETLTAGEEKGFVRFLRNDGDLHPIVVDAILTSGKVPAEIEARNVMGNKQTVSHWKLKSVERVTGDYPLTADYQSDLPQKKLAEPLRSLLPTMLEAVSGKFAGGPRSRESYHEALGDALAKGEMFKYYVLDNELALQYGIGVDACLNHWPSATDCSNANDIGRLLIADERTRAMLNTFELEQRHDFSNAIAQRRAISRDGLVDAYVVDDWLGNAMTESGNTEGAFSLIPNAIRGNPYVGSFYKDLGDTFGRSFMPKETWICYDLARALPGGGNAPIVDGIGKKEQFLETTFPEFF